MKDDNRTQAAGNDVQARWSSVIRRRSFLQGIGAAGVAVPAATLLAGKASAAPPKKLSKGDAAILKFLAAAEIIESDLWQQYSELG